MGEVVEVPDDVTLPVGDIDAVALALIVDDDVIVEVIVPLNDAEGVPLAVPPKLRELVPDAVIVDERLIVVDPLSLPEGVCDGVCDDVLVAEPVDEPVPLKDALIVDVAESLPLSLPVNDGPAPFVTDAVGEREIDFERLVVVVGVMLDVDVPVIVPLPVDVPLKLIVDDIEMEPVPLIVLDVLAPRVGDDVIEIESVPLCVFDALTPRVGDDDGVGIMIEEIEGVLVNVENDVGESEPVPTLVDEVATFGVGLLDVDALLRKAEYVAVLEIDEEIDDVAIAVGESETVLTPVDDIVDVSEEELVIDGESVREDDGVILLDGVIEGVGVNDGVILELAP